MEELAAKRKELQSGSERAKGFAALASIAPMLKGRGLASIGEGVSKFGSELGRLEKENQEADRLLMSSQVTLATAQQARADGQFDKANQLFRNAEDLKVKALDARRDVLGKQASLQATMAGQGLTAAGQKYGVDVQAQTSRDVANINARSAAATANKPGERERLLEKIDRIRAGAETYGGKSGEEGAQAYVDSLGDVGEAIMGARYRGSQPNAAQLENAITTAIAKDPAYDPIKLRYMQAQAQVAKYTNKGEAVPNRIQQNFDSVTQEMKDLRTKHETRIRAAAAQATAQNAARVPGGAASAAPAASAPLVRTRPE
jgi:hypothetical protein